MKYWLSIGHNRRAKTWKNIEMTWPELVTRLQDCKFTSETVKEYANMKPEDQAVIKDVGGFVGGAIVGGRRKKGAVTSRGLITLDLDKAPVDFWDGLVLDWGMTMAIYSTHKHTPESPRLRLIIPLDREVLPDQYEAIARWFAGRIGMEYFDPTTFQVERLMYWPSMPKDGKFLFESQTGGTVIADDILACYKDWRDVSQWPVHAGEARKVTEGIKLAADPLEKTGIVGAFCRTYGIDEAIAEYLDGVYEDAGAGRYTYLGGSTAGGLVVYDNKFAYSWHGTDPTSGHLCNAFDLVRLHKFGALDANSKEDIGPAARPSFKAMAELAAKDKGVNLDLVRQTTGKAKEAFKDSEDLDDWLATLETDKKGIKGTADNLLIILRNDPGLGGFALNAFTNRYVVTGAVPWAEAVIGGRGWTDTDDAGLRWYIERTYGITGVMKLVDCLALVMEERAFHPVREYLEGLNWDGVGRLDRLLVTYQGAADNEYTRAVTRKALVAAVARVMTPGIKYDTVLVLIGPQGSGKSTFIKTLGGQWYSDSFGRLDTNGAVENIQGVWLMEMGELAALKKTEIEVIKHFISKDKDDFRPAYGRRVQSFPRQCIFIGTSNNDKFIQDTTGGRRWWPVPVIKAGLYKGRVFNELYRERAQIWAEAVAAWKAGEDLHLDERLEEMAEAMQADHTEKDPWLELIEKYLEIPLPEGWGSMQLYDRKAYLRGEETQPQGSIQRTVVTVVEIWLECLDGDKKTLAAGQSRRIHDIVKKTGNWEAEDKKRRHGGNVVRCFVRKNVADEDI